MNFEEWWNTLNKLDCHNKTTAQLAFEAGVASTGYCNCAMSIKILGDGCSVCNPTMKREIDAYNEGFSDGIKEHSEI